MRLAFFTLLGLLFLSVAARAAADVDGVRAHLREARAQWRVSARTPALNSLSRAMRQARETGDGRLALDVAREAAVIARRLGADDHAMAYERLAAEEQARGDHALKGAEAFAVGELPKPRALPPELVRYIPPPTPLGMYSHRSTVAAFRKRVKEDPAFLADLTRLKTFRDDPTTTIVETLQEPGVPVEAIRRFKDDYKTITEALGYYKFALKLGRTVEDEFALATLYINMTVLRTNNHPALQWIYGATKTAAIVEAASRILAFNITGGTMDLTILALDKLIIDMVRKYDRTATDSVSEDLIGSTED